MSITDQLFEICQLAGKIYVLTDGKDDEINKLARQIQLIIYNGENV